MDAISTVKQWSLHHQGEPIQIKKNENDDIDLVIMNLANVTYEALDRDHHDSYLADYAICIHGSGVIDAQSYLLQNEIPDDIYILPIEGTPSAYINGNQLHIETERAHYVLKGIHR